MPRHSPFRHFKTSPEIIPLAVMMLIQFPLSLRNVEDFLHGRGLYIYHGTARFRWIRSRQKFASAHASVFNHFNQVRAIYSRQNFKINRAAALAEWRAFFAG